MTSNNNTGSSPSTTVTIRPYNPDSDFDSLLDHLLKIFRPASPLMSGLDLSQAETAPIFNHLLKEAEKANCSYVACINNSLSPFPVEIIVGCVLASIEDQEDANWSSSSSSLSFGESSTTTLVSPSQKVFMNFVDEMFKSPLEEFSMARVLKLDVFSVDPAHRGRGLCKTMLDLCIQDAVEKQRCDVALSLATSHISQAILMTERKFITVKCCYFDDYNKRQQQNQQNVRFHMKDPGNTSARVLAKILT